MMMKKYNMKKSYYIFLVDFYLILYYTVNHSVWQLFDNRLTRNNKQKEQKRQLFLTTKVVKSTYITSKSKFMPL